MKAPTGQTHGVKWLFLLTSYLSLPDAPQLSGLLMLEVRN